MTNSIKLAHYMGLNGNMYMLSKEPFAKGGEGSVYDVFKSPNYVAKIYHQKGRTKEREDKIKAMLDNPPSDKVRSQIAWPTDVIYLNGSFVGFIMPRIAKISKIDILYSYDNRDNHSWRWYIKVAKNLCAAIDGVHQCGHVCGDLNPANICVEEATGLVTLVDTDSYHIISPKGKVFRCPVCMLAYVPSEIHQIINRGSDLRTEQGTTFTVQTDYFALAVHIFALLMNGCHPFACAVTGNYSASNFQININIEKYISAFLAPVPQIKIPKYAPSLDILTSEIRTLFKRALVYDINLTNRPTATEWFNALSNLEKQLTSCSKIKEHQYYASNLSECPWCAIEKVMHKQLSTQQAVKRTQAFTPKMPAVPPIIARPRINLPPKINKPNVATVATNIPKTAHLGFLLQSLAIVLAFVVLAIWVLPQYFIIKNFSIPLGIGTVFGILWLGAYPFIPTWASRIAVYFTGSRFIERMWQAFSELSTLYPFVLYGVILAFDMWGSSWFDIILSAVVATVPSMIIKKLFGKWI